MKKRPLFNGPKGRRLFIGATVVWKPVSRSSRLDFLPSCAAHEALMMTAGAKVYNA